jgi:hypothetical protein
MVVFLSWMPLSVTMPSFKTLRSRPWLPKGKATRIDSRAMLSCPYKWKNFSFVQGPTRAPRAGFSTVPCFLSEPTMFK